MGSVFAQWATKGTKIDTDALKQDRDQLWAEAVDIYSKKQETFWLKTTPEYVVNEQDERYVEDDWEAVIERALTNKTNWRIQTDKNGKSTAYVTTLDLLTEILQIKLGFITHRDQRRVASILHRLGFVSQRIRVNGVRERIFYKSDS